jgi:hypothetical protein
MQVHPFCLASLSLLWTDEGGVGKTNLRCSNRLSGTAKSKAAKAPSYAEKEHTVQVFVTWICEQILIDQPEFVLIIICYMTDPNQTPGTILASLLDFWLLQEPFLRFIAEDKGYWIHLHFSLRQLATYATCR